MPQLLHVLPGRLADLFPQRGVGHQGLQDFCQGGGIAGVKKKTQL
jgi:hypothetical protein